MSDNARELAEKAVEVVTRKFGVPAKPERIENMAILYAEVSKHLLARAAEMRAAGAVGDSSPPKRKRVAAGDVPTFDDYERRARR